MSLLFTLLYFEKVTLSVFLSLPSSLRVCLSVTRPSVCPPPPPPFHPPQISCLESGCCRRGDTSCLISLGWKRCPRRTAMSSWRLQVSRSDTLRCPWSRHTSEDPLWLCMKKWKRVHNPLSPTLIERCFLGGNLESTSTTRGLQLPFSLQPPDFWWLWDVVASGKVIKSHSVI